MASERRFVAENVRRVLLREYLMKEVSRAGFGGLDIQRTPMGTRVVLTTERPGLVIGRRGQTIKNLTSAIENNFGFDNPQIEVQEVEDPNLNAQIMAEKLAFALERGWHFRRAGHSSVRRIMESGARGCQVVVSGKLTGQRHRCEKFKDGYIKFCGEPKLQFIDTGYAVAKLKQGVIGCTVEIMRPGSTLPSDITVISKTDAAEALPELFSAPAEDEEGTEDASLDVDEAAADAAIDAEEPAAETAAETAEEPAEGPDAAAEEPEEAPAEPSVKAEEPAEGSDEKAGQAEEDQ